MSEKRKDNNGRLLRTGESQRGANSYMYRYNDGRGKRQCIYAKTLSELREKEKEAEKGSQEKRGFQAGKVKLADYIDSYYKKKKNMSEGTTETYLHYVRYIKSLDIGDMCLGEIKTYHVKKFVTDMAQEGKSYSTIKLIMTVINNAVKEAVEDELIVRNPFTIKLNFIEHKKKTTNVLSKEETKKFLEFIKHDECSHKIYDLAAFLLSTGMRIGETLGLTWNDVDLELRTINIKHQLLLRNNELRMSKLKTAAGYRTIYITDSAMEVLCRLANNRSSIISVVDGHKNFIFTHNGIVVSSEYYREALYVACRRYERITGEHIKVTPHVLRHTFCTRMVEEGMDLKSLQYIMGHSDINITLNIYTHASAEKAALEMMKASVI